RSCCRKPATPRELDGRGAASHRRDRREGRLVSLRGQTERNCAHVPRVPLCERGRCGRDHDVHKPGSLSGVPQRPRGIPPRIPRRMTDLQYFQLLVTVITLTLLAAIAVAIVTGRSVADRIGRGFAVGAEILLILFMAWPGGSTAQTAALKPDAE